MDERSPFDVPPALVARIVALRRDLHRHPELSWREEQTAARVEEELRALGLRPRRICGTGVVAEIPGEHAGPLVALRGDLDALPIDEETGLPFASANAGVMHACGHDGHTAMLVGAAALLVQGPPSPCGIRLVFQPAEETGAGAPALVEAGVLDEVGAIFGGHLDRLYPAGEIAVQPGPVNASTDDFHLRVVGRQGHGGRPHEAVDAIVVGSHLVMALQALVSREVNPGEAAVVSVGRFHAGTAPNVIAGEAQLSGTLRAQSPEVRAQLRAGVRRVAEAVGALYGAEVEVRLREGTPPLRNVDPGLTLAREAAVEVVGAERVVSMATANMGGEDFAFFLEHVPGCYVRFGGRPPEGESHPAHSSRFDFDEAALPVGAAWLAAVARRAGAWLVG